MFKILVELIWLLVIIKWVFIKRTTSFWKCPVKGMMLCYAPKLPFLVFLFEL